MWNSALWLKDVIAWAVILALPIWLLAEEVMHRRRAPSLARKARARRTSARPARTATPKVRAAEGTVRA